MIFGAIVAGGIGTRMKNMMDMPKQFLPLGKDEKPIIIHTIEKFMLCNKFDFIYIGINKDWLDYAKNLLEKYNLNSEKVFLVSGGSDRNLTIMNIINAIENNHKVTDDSIIVTHDAVRPFVTLKMIEENIQAAIKYNACDTVVSAIDTIVQSDKKKKFIENIPNREYMYLGQTPQSFNMLELKNLYNSLTNDEKNVLTDACKIFNFRNKPVYLVEGGIFNLKITTEHDYKIANAILGGIKID